MTFTDTRHFYLENEELVESREVEREELKEGAEDRDWLKFLSGGNGLFNNHLSHHLPQFTRFHCQGIKRHYSLLSKCEIALFLKHCCLKIPLG